MVERDSILVVDDDEGVLTVLKAELGELYVVTAVGSAEHALAELQSKEFSAIVSDVRLPGMDGLSLINKCAVRYPNMVRVILTGFDDTDVHAAAVGPHGAYKVTKPWGDELIITLRNALKQRRLNLALKKHLNLKAEILEIDRKLNPGLDADTLIYEAAVEMTRTPEVVAAALYRLDRSGESKMIRAVLTAEDGIVPMLRHNRSGPIPIENGYLYSLPIGEPGRPYAIVALHLTDVGGDTLRYLDFVSRQAARAMLIVTSGIGDNNRSEETTDRKDVPISWLIQELTTPTTVLSSAPYSMTKILEAVQKANCDEDDFEAMVKEMEELFGDISKVAVSLSALLNQLRTESRPTGTTDPFPDESSA